MELDPGAIVKQIDSISGSERRRTVPKLARQLRRWIKTQAPEDQERLLQEFENVLRWAPVDTRRRPGDRHRPDRVQAPRPDHDNRFRPERQRQRPPEWKGRITGIDGEGWGLEAPEGKEMDLMLDDAPDPWPEVHRAIKRRGYIRPGPLVNRDAWKHLGVMAPLPPTKVKGVPADVLAAELPLEVPELRGLWQPSDGVPAMLEVLQGLWEAHTARPKRTRIRWQGRQVYKLLVAVTSFPNGRFTQWRLWNDGERLTTKMILDWLFQIPYPGHLVGFGLGYDFAHWLLDLEPEQLELLRRGERVSWDRYTLSWIPGKFLEVQLSPRRRRIVHDAFSWYQTSFETALKKTIAVPERIRDEIAQGKARRGDDRDLAHDLKQEIRYASAEMWALGQMQRHLYTQCENARYPLSRYNGPGSLGEKMFQVHGVRQHFGTIPPQVQSDLLLAHVGGRFEDAALGQFQRLYGFDLASAYPWAATQLPSFRGSSWERVDVDGWEVGETGFYRVRFSSPRGDYWGPFPVRDRQQRVYWPRWGETWVWSPELEAALGHWPFKVLEGWRVRLPHAQERPLGFFAELFQRRLELKARGDPMANVFRLGPNSAYGKLSQTIGKPPYRFLPWASMITSLTRARLLWAIRQAGPQNVVGVATDAIYVRRPFFQPFGTLRAAGLGGLGDWEGPKPMSEVLLVGSGFMRYREDQRTRGLRPHEVPWDQLRGTWEAFWDKGGPGALQLLRPQRVWRRQFIGISLGLLWGHPEMIGSWVWQERGIRFFSHKSPGMGGTVDGERALWRVQRRQPRPRQTYGYSGFRDWAHELEKAEEEGIGGA